MGFNLHRPTSRGGGVGDECPGGGGGESDSDSGSIPPVDRGAGGRGGSACRRGSWEAESASGGGGRGREAVVKVPVLGETPGGAAVPPPPPPPPDLAVARLLAMVVYMLEPCGGASYRIGSGESAATLPIVFAH